jgi:hypothetical protein
MRTGATAARRAHMLLAVSPVRFTSPDFVAGKRQLVEVRLDPCAVEIDELQRRTSNDRHGFVHLPGRQSDVFVLNRRTTFLRLNKLSTKLPVDDLRPTQRLKCLTCAKTSPTFGLAWQANEQHPIPGKVSDVALNSPGCPFHGLYVPIGLPVFAIRIKCPFEPGQVEIGTECADRKLQSLILVREVIEMSGDLALEPRPLCLAKLLRTHRRSSRKRSIRARAARLRLKSRLRPRLRKSGSRRRNSGHICPRSTSTLPSSRAIARKVGSFSASFRSTTSTDRPTASSSLRARPISRMKSESRKSTITSTSLRSVSSPLAADPKSIAKRTLCSVRNASRSLAIKGQCAHTYRLSANDSSSFRGDGRLARKAPSLNARLNVRSLTPTSFATKSSAVMCPL